MAAKAMMPPHIRNPRRKEKSRRVVKAFKDPDTDPEIQKRVETIGTMLSYTLSVVVLVVAAMLAVFVPGDFFATHLGSGLLPPHR